MSIHGACGSMSEQHVARVLAPSQAALNSYLGYEKPQTAGANQPEQSEVWREIELISNRVEHLAHAVDALWERLGSAGVLAPTPLAQPAEIDTSGLDSPLAGVLRKQSHFVSQHELRLRNLIAALRV